MRPFRTDDTGSTHPLPNAPPGETFGGGPRSIKLLVAVLDGGVAVRCNPKPALAGLKSRSRLCVHRPTASSAVLKAWSCAATTFEPCQVRKEAAVRSARRVPQGCRARASGLAAEAARRSTTGARPPFG